jgi:hypothetical protein
MHGIIEAGQSCRLAAGAGAGEVELTIKLWQHTLLSSTLKAPRASMLIYSVAAMSSTDSGTAQHLDRSQLPLPMGGQLLLVTPSLQLLMVVIIAAAATSAAAAAVPWGVTRHTSTHNLLGERLCCCCCCSPS